MTKNIMDIKKKVKLKGADVHSKDAVGEKSLNGGNYYQFLLAS